MTPMTLSPATAFDLIAATYDDEFSNSLVGRAQRNAVWREMDRTFSEGQCVLELNCGTGEDAVHLAERGIRVVALDASRAMIGTARRRVEASDLNRLVHLNVMSNEGLEGLSDDTAFDGMLSNFSGLNCTQDLRPFAQQLGRLLKPGALALICVFGRVCAWEIVSHLLTGRLRKAFRRMRTVLTGQVGRDTSVTVYYHSLQSMKKAFEPYFMLEGWQGIGIFVPPSYLEHFARRFPGAMGAAEKMDKAIARWAIWRNLADHQLLVFRRRDQ